MAVDHISSLKAMCWEETKGKLRAMTALSGSGQNRTPNFKKVEEFVENFISAFEYEGLHE